jgi:RNA-dependent RNA polymerase
MPSLPLPTVFQIRHGGKKGLLVAYPDDIFDRIAGPEGRDKVVVRRPSMTKYASCLNMLEIASISGPKGCAGLNVQFIILLLTRGIPIEV